MNTQEFGSKIYFFNGNLLYNREIQFRPAKKSAKTCICAIFVVPLQQILQKMVNFSQIWTTIKINKWGKYVITILVFLVIFLFVGDQSMLHFFHRHKEIKNLEEQRDMYLEGAQRAQYEIQVLQNPDSLERYAREQYFMHAPGEDIYLVEEK